MTKTAIEILQETGAHKNNIISFNEASSHLQNYLDLLTPPQKSAKLDGVIEANGNPILYFIDHCNLASPANNLNEINNTRDILACRGENTALVVVAPGQITLYSINLSNNDSGFEFQASEYINLISELLEGEITPELTSYLYGSNKKQFIHQKLFSLLKHVGLALNNTLALAGKHETILSLTGRALLTRFLIDRRIITLETFPQAYENGQVLDCFSSPEKCAIVNKWLDKTFNGDLLPLSTDDYDDWLKSFEPIIFSYLSLILKDIDENGQMWLPGFLDFSYVPVGLLSEVYEQFVHENLDLNVRSRAKNESVHYTPHHIAKYMFEQTLNTVTTNEKHLSKVLDPSCGAGVFLITAFRRLIAEHWKATGKRPNTYQIRDILYKQITGFDINKEALNLAALGLYLSALELDPEPLPTTKLKFKKNLIGNILIHAILPKEANLPYKMGSLGKAISKEHNQKYDIVIGNPPWTSLDKSLKSELSQVIQDVATRRNKDTLKETSIHHENPDQVPDLPFVWKSMEWAKKNGNIAFALHSRFLFKNSKIGIKSRNELFKAVNTTGILNASALRTTNVWPNISAQFCLFFAKNEIPTDQNFFYFVSPYAENYLNNKQGRMRIDHSSAHPVQLEAIEENEYLLKTLYRGSALDVRIINKIKSLISLGTILPVKQYWSDNFDSLSNGVGFQKTQSEKMDAQFLIDMGAVELTKDSKASYIINSLELQPFKTKRLHRTRTKQLYQTPLVLINKAIGANKESISARISIDSTPVAFNESFYGFSTHSHPHAELLAKYLFIIFNSDLVLYFLLMTSSQYGVEREVIHKSDIDKFPIVDFEKIDESKRDDIEQIYSSFLEHRPDLQRLNTFVYSLYSLDTQDVETITDTLSVSLPTSTSMQYARKKVHQLEEIRFINTLAINLMPYKTEINLIPTRNKAWKCFQIKRKTTNNKPLEQRGVDNFQSDNTNNGTSQIKIISHDSITVMLLDQYRYWTRAQAKLLAIDLINQEHTLLEAFQKDLSL